MGHAPALDPLKIKGVGDATLAKLARLGIHSPHDLLLHLPLRYEDETRVLPIAHALIGQHCQLEGEVTEARVQYAPRKALVATLADATGEITLRFLNFYGSQVKQLAEGTRIRVIGELRLGFFGPEMVHPKYQVISRPLPLKTSLTPIYPTTAGLSQEVLRRLVHTVLEGSPPADTLPREVLAALSLPGFAESVRYLHQPPPEADLYLLEKKQHPAWQRLKFDELLAQQLSMRLHYNRRRSQDAPNLPYRGHLAEPFLAALPFGLTGAQARVVAEIRGDLAKSFPMQRLLQGDVGAGKTLVAVLGCLQAIENGYQAAFMAPTEILAEQHAQKLIEWLTPLGVTVVQLTASLPKKEKDAALAALADGSAQLVVGTHALFQDQVHFARLGVVVIDEQHRFGVEQRLRLRQKGRQPHQLMMSATPIPRTLSMSYYADLDVSTIDELPPGRTPIVTRLVDSSRRDEVLARIHVVCQSGQQAYWVCPLIEESEVLQLQTAQATFEDIQAVFPDLRVGLVHGRLHGRDKDAVMRAFAAGDLDLLVATTVIEVGVDVPNASIMVIEHAERMGLSQLHQLRGRVGRGAAKSSCVLLYQQPLSETARARLKIIYESTDGFEIAREDLALRGPGEFLGARQSGEPMLKIADLNEDLALLEAAQEWAARLVEDEALVKAHLDRWIGHNEQYLKV